MDDNGLGQSGAFIRLVAAVLTWLFWVYSASRAAHIRAFLPDEYRKAIE
ncbi:hypothetical protein ACFFUP_12260 [Vibrio ostreicida]|uniref:Uncharacterized protein n=1 Tax=Vibrio ostreicida TaxID=526588 RepID=A0ABT8BY08_9VIBR|nr:hypothetical protein [Vibrio ostreicida]MDN3611279.1 hypothetical protein [Vibrio ostreicida]MDN3612609.1 hypothetical protein [Vibrio ostreicida]